jgi:hypothetical protein
MTFITICFSQVQMGQSRNFRAFHLEQADSSRTWYAES